MHPSIRRKTGLVAAAFLLAASAALAGCVGEVRQTEPFRVQVDDGDGEEVEVREDDGEPRRVVIDNPERVETVDVEVAVTSASDGPVVVLVKIVDADTDEVFAGEEISVGGDEPDGTPENDTNESTDDDMEGRATIQNINVHGKDNFVVIAQSQEGDANVQITAVTASDGEDLEDDNETEPSPTYTP